MAESKYKRVLLKLSGESFCSPGGFGIEGEALESIAERIFQLCTLGPEVAIVVGAGNFIRGETFSQKSRIPRNTADYMGMLSTIINACALQETLEKLGQPTRVLSAIEVNALCEPFIRRKALWHLENGRVANLLIKATKVDGVYSDDPKTNPDAEFFDKLSYEDVLKKSLRIMDQAAISLCRENNIPVIVLNIFETGNITDALCGRKVGTLIS
jgi:uridylate kinase